MKYLDVVVVSLLLVFGLFYFNEINNDTSNKGIYYDNLSYTDNVKVNSVDGLNIDYSAELNNVGDSYELKFDVINSTSVDMIIKDCIFNHDDPYVDYVLTYSDGETINNGDIIKKGESRSLVYRVLYKNNIKNNEYAFDSGFNIQYEQVL